MSQQADSQPSKNALKKMQKEAEKKLKKLEHKTQPNQAGDPGSQPGATSSTDLDVSLNLYGILPINRSSQHSTHTYTEIGHIDLQLAGQSVWVRGRVHTSRQTGGKNLFLVLRRGLSSLQAVASVGPAVSKQLIRFAAELSRESIVDVAGVVVAAPRPVESCSQQSVELHVAQVWLVNAAQPRLPLQIEDAMRSLPSEEGGSAEGEDQEGAPRATLHSRLENRCLDLRTPTNHSIYRLQAGVVRLFRGYLETRDFVEVFTPKLIGAASEGGANVFQLPYFDKSACLAQSPQLYKQFVISSDFDRVFCIGGVFRAENSNTHRHLTEFNGLDIEMAFKSHYHEVLDLICDMFVHMFQGLQLNYQREIQIVNKTFKSEPFLFLQPTLRLSFVEGIGMLKEAGWNVSEFEDLSTPAEKFLGKLVRAKYQTDFYVLDKFPLAVRPFYTMPDLDDPRFSNSYDIFMRGEEIMSGSQRIHDVQMLTEAAIKCGVDVEKIRSYIECFQYGAYPHAGGGIGLERVTMLFLGLPNIRLASMFPRDPTRLTP